MDASAVAMSNGFHYRSSVKLLDLKCAIIFSFFQGTMPLIGYLVGHTLLSLIENWLSWISFCILLVLGVNMILNTVKEDKNKCKDEKITLKLLILQGIATSLDALTSGFILSEYSLFTAILCGIIIALITFIICLLAFRIGKKFGEKYGNIAEIIGGVILCLIGVEIFITSLF